MKNNKIKYNGQGFIKINNNIFFSNNFINLSDQAKIVYFSLCSYSNGNGKSVWPKMKMLSEIANKSERTIQRCLAELKENQLIDIKYQDGKNNLYEFLTPDKSVTPVKVDTPSPPTELTPTPDKSVTPPPTNSVISEPSNIDQQTETGSLTIQKNNTNNNTNGEVDDLNKKPRKKKELEGERKKVENLVNRLHVNLTTEAEAGIRKLSDDKCKAIRIQYKHDEKNSRITGTPQTWWNNALINKDFDLSIGFGIIKEDIKDKKLERQTALIFEEQDKYKRNGQSILAAYKTKMGSAYIPTKNDKDSEIIVENPKKLNQKEGLL